MHLLYVIPRYGPQFMSNETHGEIVRELQKLGLEVTVLSFTTRKGAGGKGGWGKGFGTERVYRSVQGENLFERFLAPLSASLLHYEYFPAMLRGYFQIAKGGRYDLIHVEGTFPLGAVAALASPFVQTPYLITTTGGDLFRLPGQRYGYGQYLLPRSLISLALRRATWLRLNSRLIGRLATKYGANPQRMTPLAVSIADTSFPPVELPLATYRAKWRETLANQHHWDSSPLLVCVGRLISLKAPELLLEALPQMLKKLGKVQVAFIGPSRADPAKGDYLTFLQKRATELEVAKYCTFMGHIPLPQIKQYLAAADLLVVPSRLEGLNRVVIEAGAVGTPTVISDGAGAAELVARYSCGLIFPTGDAAALAHALTRLLTSPNALAQCGERSLALARDYSAEAVAKGLQRIYTSALNLPSSVLCWNQRL